MTIGIDFDGTITKNPFLFKHLIELFQKNNDIVYIVSGTAEEHRNQLKQELYKYGIFVPESCIILKPTYGNLNETTQWKVSQVDKLKIRLFIDNNSITLDAIGPYCTTFLIR